MKESPLLLKDFYKNMTAISKKVYFDILNDIVDKYNNTYHNTIKMNPIDVKEYSLAEYNEESNEKDPKIKINDHDSIGKYKMFSLKDVLLTGVKRFLL